MSEPTDTIALLHALEPTVETNLNRHLATAKEWFPHEYVPWSAGRDFNGIMGGEAWAPEQSQLPELARTSLIVNLLTEDNLPSYHYEIATTFGRDGAWGTWVHRWTAEEGRHGTAIRDYLTTTRAVDPVALERARMTHMAAGFANEQPGVLSSISYVSFQELATRVAHRNTGHVSGDPICDQLLAKVAADENLHMLFYRNLLGAALELAPNGTMRAITDVVKSFQMPGHGIEGFGRKAVQIAMGGIYDLPSTTTRCSRRSCASSRCSSGRGCRGGARRRATNSPSSSPGWTPRPPGSRRSGPPSRRARRPGSDDPATGQIVTYHNPVESRA